MQSNIIWLHLTESKVIMAKIKEYECRYIFKSVFQSFTFIHHCNFYSMTFTALDNSRWEQGCLMQTDILMLRFQENLYSTWVIMSGSFKRGSSRLICLGLLSTSGYYRCLFVFLFLFVACCLKSVIRIYFTFLLTYIFQFNAVVLIALILMPILKIFSSVLFFFATDPKSTSGLFTSATQKNRSIGLWSRWSSQKYVCCPSQWLMTRVITTKDKTGIRI